MEVTCPQCRARQRLSPKEAALFWAVCSECGLVHGPAAAKAGDGLSLKAGVAPPRDQQGDAADWVPTHEMFDDILTLEDEEDEGGSHAAEPWPPDDVFGTVVTVSAESPAQIELPEPPAPLELPEPPAPLAFEAPREADADDEGDTLPADKAQDVIHLSEPPEGRSESEVEGPPPVPSPVPPPVSPLASPLVPPPVPLRQPAPAADGYAVGARVLRIAPVWVLLSSVGFLFVILLLSWASKPARSLMADASSSASGGPKTEATNQSHPQALPPLTASVNSAPKPVEAAHAEERGAKTQAEDAEAVAARETDAGEGGGSFTAQVGSYRDAANADERVSALRAAGFEARAVEVEIPGRGLWHRVQCGRFGTREEAARFGARLRAKGVVREVIITEVREQ